MRGFYLSCGSQGKHAPLRLAPSRRALNALRGHEDNEADSQAVGRGEAAGGEGFLRLARRLATPALRSQWSPPRTLKILPRVPGTRGRVGGEGYSERRSRRGHIPGALGPLGAGKRVRTMLWDKAGEAPVLRVRRRRSHSRRVEWRRSPSARSGRGQGGDGGGGAGARVGDKEPPCGRESDPCVRRVLLFVGAQTTLDSGALGGRRGPIPRAEGVRLCGAREGGRGTLAGEGVRSAFQCVSFKGSPALPFPPSPSLHCTCILKAPCSPGIGPGRVLRRRNLNRQREEGVLKAQWMDCTISAASPP